MKTTRTLVSALAISAFAGAAVAGDFGTIDIDANGQVDFQEYKAHALKDGKTSTLAAQEFTSMTQGDATLTEDEFLIAEVNAVQTIEGNNVLIADPMTSEPMEYVAPADIAADVPQTAEAVEAETNVETEMSWEDEAPDSVTSTTEIEAETEVEGEVTTSDAWTVPDVSVPEVIVPEIVPEVVAEPELDLSLNFDTEVEASDDIKVPEAPELPTELTVD